MKKKIGTYNCIRTLGKGHYASVILAESDGKLVAIKCLQREGISKNQLLNVENEVVALQNVEHSNIIRMVDRLKSNSNYYLVLDYCNGGDLASYLKLKIALKEEVARLIVMQVLEGLKYLVEKHIIHRDIKLANILLHFPGMNS